jgi:dihydrolipoamide dehydrogenase
MVKENTYDLIIIGSGPGGYVAAIRAAQLGLKTLIIEEKKLGGVCLNWGCIPTKALLRASEIKHIISDSKAYGINIDNSSDDWDLIIDRSRKVADKLSKGVEYLLKKNKIDVVYGFGTISGVGRVIVNDGTNKNLYIASNIILATGARPKNINGLLPDNKNIWSYKEAMIPDKKPESILIIGGGAIGVEFASFYNDFGTKVTIIEAQKHILPSEDIDVSIFVREKLEQDGIKILTNTKINKITSLKNMVNAEIIMEDGTTREEKFSKSIVSIGIESNIENIGLDTVNVKQENGRIITDHFGQTSEKGIFAIGDITGAPWLAHKASHEGINAANYISNPKEAIKHKKIIPGCTYSRPQVASIGLTEKKAKEIGLKIKVGVFPLLGNGKAIALGDSNGFVKTIFNEDNGELIGAHMVGPEVTELISTYAVAMQLEATEIDLFNTVFPHPTVSESIHESVLDAYDRAIHI